MQLTPGPDGGDPTDLTARVFRRLDRRLSHGVDRPVALALSGGGDSIALLRLAADWSRRRGRPMLALTVDHGLSPESAAWTAFARDAARAEGVDWRGLAWEGDKPASGLTAAARMARHRLIATAAREAGARVILFAHTADDVAEADWMRAEGSTLGRLRDWSPSPAWPEGRGLMLHRPLLAERRAVLRAWLVARDAAWIEDPANADPRFGRSRARRALAEGGATADRTPPSTALGPRRVALDGGVILLDRGVGGRALAAALVCSGGGATPPRGDRLTALTTRLRAGETFVATLCGARVEATVDHVRVMREAGEWGRRPLAPLALPPGVETVWDGRQAFVAAAPGWSVVPSRGRLAGLSATDRARIAALPPAARRALPVLLRDGETAPVLASAAVERRDLVPERLRLALDETPHEDDLTHAPDGATPSNALFSRAEHPDRWPATGRRTTEDLNEPA